MANRFTRWRLLSVLISVALWYWAVPGIAACNPEVLPTCCTAETIYVCQELVPPSIECVEGEICGSSATFHIVGLNSGMERIQKIRHYFGDGDCPPDEILEDLPIPLQINIGWSVVADGTSYTGTGGLASVALPGDISSASCTFTLSANPSLCSQLDPIIYSVDAVAPTSQVAIASTEVDLPRINNLAPDLGWLLVVNTNLSKAVPVQLTVSMKPADGQVTLSMEERTAPVELWFRDNTGTNCILDASILERTYPYDEWLAMVGDVNSPRGEFLLLSAATGSCRLTLGCSVSTECEEVYETTNQLLTVVSPLLLPDYNRDGKIDTSDEELYLRGSIFRFWVNDDADRNSTDGKYAEAYSVDLPGALYGHFEIDGSDPDWCNNNVDGYRDLVDFTPIQINVPFICRITEDKRSELEIRLRQTDSAINIVWSGLDKDNVGDFQKSLLNNCGECLNEISVGATVTNLQNNATAIPEAILTLLKSCQAERGVFFVEGRAASNNPIVVDIRICGQHILTFELASCISSVEEMYRFYSLRGAAENRDFQVNVEQSPGNTMGFQRDIDIFFLHGFNVNDEAAHGWGSEIFKRLWQSGSNSRFNMITWYGNYSWAPGEFFNGLHYQQNVWYAQRTSSALRCLVETLQTNAANRVLMAHSLGNMVACEALREGLQVAQYYMFDAALPSESIDGTLRAETAEDAPFPKYVPNDWHGYTNTCWAANWHQLFSGDLMDSRGRMGWTGRFTDALTNATEVYNYYSSGDDVFKEFPVVPSWFDGLDVAAVMYCWQKQETLKGSAVLAGTAYGGWGFHTWTVRELVQDIGGSSYYEDRTYRYSPEDAVRMVADGSIVENAVFNRDFSPMFDSEASQDDQWLIVAKYVPAVSSPVGGMAVLPTKRNNVDMNDPIEGVSRPNRWGRDSPDWQHSDMKDMAYFYVYKLYEQLIQKGDLK